MRDVDAFAVERAEQLAGDPVSHCFWVAARARGHALVIFGGRALSDQYAGIVRRQPVLRHETRPLRAGQFWQLGAQPLDPIRVEHQRQQIGIGKIPVVVRFLLRAHQPGDAARGIEKAGLLLDLSALLDELDLAPSLMLDRLHHIADRVDVLDLATRTQGLAWTSHRDVAVAAQRALLHVAVAGAEIAQDRAQFAQIETGLLGAPQIGLRDDLHQRDTGPVQIHESQGRMLVVQALAGILLEMQPGDADLAHGPVGHVQTDPAVSDNRLLILRDLITGRQVGIKVVLALEDAVQVDLGIEAEPGLDRLLNAKPVNDRQHPRKRGVDRRNLGVGLRPEIGRRPGKQLSLRDHLSMDLDPDHRLPLPRAALDHPRPPAIKPGRCRNEAAFSKIWATRSTVSSSKARPVICKPSGSPSALSPTGTEIAGTPARFAGTVKTSFKYIAIGSSVFSPTIKAADGAVGVRMQSTSSNASAKSRAIKVRTRCAFR